MHLGMYKQCSVNYVHCTMVMSDNNKIQIRIYIKENGLREWALTRTQLM